MKTPNPTSHIQLRQFLISLAHHHTVSMPILSERELAAKFHLARETVRKNLESLVHDKYLICRPRQGYFTNPAGISNFERARKLIGILIGQGGHSFYSFDELSFLAPLYNEALKYQTTIQTIQCINAEAIFQTIINSNLDGCIWLNADEAIFRQLTEKAAFPVMALFNRPVACKQNLVLVDHQVAGRQEVRQLVKTGCQNIALVPWDNEYGEIQGAKQELEEQGLFQPELFLPEEHWQENLKNLMVQGRIQGVIAYGDRLTAVLEMARENQVKIPETVQVIGNWIPTEDKATMIKKPHGLIARTIFAKLIKAMQQQIPQPKSVIGKWELVQGTTTKP